IYTAASQTATIGTGWTAYPLWVANWGVQCPSMPSDWKQWLMWQSSSTGTVSGITGNVDLDTFNGSLQDLITFAEGPMMPDAGAMMDASIPSMDASAPPPPPPPPPMDASNNPCP